MPKPIEAIDAQISIAKLRKSVITAALDHFPHSLERYAFPFSCHRVHTGLGSQGIALAILSEEVLR
jgi:hypothetical protein